MNCSCSSTTLYNYNYNYNIIESHPHLHSQFSVLLNADEKKMMYFVSHQWKMKAKCDTIRTINNFLSDKISPFHRGASRKFNTHQVLTGEPTFKAFQKMF